jgi:hypothetical protein
MRVVHFPIAVVLALLAVSANADVFYDVPVVTQVQGVAFYRTSLAISNLGPRTLMGLNFVYRSPVDNTMQFPQALATVESLGTFATDDVVEFMKNNSPMRAVDKTMPLFGTLEVVMASTVDPTDVAVVARTYSPGTGGNGTVGIAYVGRPYSTASQAFTRMTTTVRNGTFGHEGNTRANLGFVSLGNLPMDLKIQYIDAATGLSLKTFTLSSAAGHLLESREVVQLGNIFGDPALAGVSRIIVIVTQIGEVQGFTGYAVQLDNTTNDGSFFLFSEK